MVQYTGHAQEGRTLRGSIIYLPLAHRCIFTHKKALTRHFNLLYSSSYISIKQINTQITLFRCWSAFENQWWVLHYNSNMFAKRLEENISTIMLVEDSSALWYLLHERMECFTDRRSSIAVGYGSLSNLGHSRTVANEIRRCMYNNGDSIVELLTWPMKIFDNHFETISK